MAEVQSVTDGKPRFSRILLKLSGEALAPEHRRIHLDDDIEVALEQDKLADALDLVGRAAVEGGQRNALR